MAKRERERLKENVRERKKKKQKSTLKCAQRGKGHPKVGFNEREGAMASG